LILSLSENISIYRKTVSYVIFFVERERKRERERERERESFVNYIIIFFNIQEKFKPAKKMYIT